MTRKLKITQLASVRARIVCGKRTRHSHPHCSSPSHLKLEKPYSKVIVKLRGRVMHSGTLQFSLWALSLCQPALSKSCPNATSWIVKHGNIK